MQHVSFSERHGFAEVDADVTVRHEAPADVRTFVVRFAYQAGLKPSEVRSLVCDVLLVQPDPTNWSERPNVDNEVCKLLNTCHWFEVYDIIEVLAAKLTKDALWAQGDPEKKEAPAKFTAQINTLLRKKGVGWQLIDGKVEVRGPDTFERAVRPAVAQLQAAGMQTAAGELHEALRDLARRPDADITGAIQHAMAATECVARQATASPKATLGQILSRHPGLVPPPLDQALDKIWGYASETARHMREGKTPTYEEAELTLIVSAGVVTYIEKKLRTSSGGAVG